MIYMDFYAGRKENLVSIRQFPVYYTVKSEFGNRLNEREQTTNVNQKINGTGF